MLKRAIRRLRVPGKPAPGAQRFDPLARPDVRARNAFLAQHVFIHTHNDKTAGSALVQGLAEIVGWANTFDTRTRPSLEAAEMTAAERRLIRLYTGHFDYGQHRHFRQKPLYIAAVRSPAERAVSYYRFVKARPQHELYPLIAQLDVNAALDALAAREGSLLRNGQTRRLFGRHFGDGQSEEAIARQMTDAYFAVIPQRKVGQFIATLRQAMLLPRANLAQFNVGKGPDIEITAPLRRQANALAPSDRTLFLMANDAWETTLGRVSDYVAECCRT